jgi:hypothetical protein
MQEKRARQKQMSGERDGGRSGRKEKSISE